MKSFESLMSISFVISHRKFLFLVAVEQFINNQTVELSLSKHTLNVVVLLFRLAFW